MEPQLKKNAGHDSLIAEEIIHSAGRHANEFSNSIRQTHFASLEDLLVKLSSATGKKSFLIFKDHKYVNVLTENIAFFHIRYESAMIMSFDRQEYFVKYSLDHIQGLLPKKQFYRINRQYLINFDVIKEAEHYFARKLLVNPVIPAKDKLIVSKDKVRDFLHWLDNR